MSLCGTDKHDFWRNYLGTSTPKIPICYTINISPKQDVKIKTKGKIIVVKWGVLRPTEQKDFLTDLIRDHIYPKVDACLFTFELCKSGEVHSHGLCLIQDKLERAQFWLTDLQKQILQDPKFISMCKRNINRVRTMNYIHKCDSIEAWLDYLIKDKDKVPFEPYMCVPALTQ